MIKLIGLLKRKSGMSPEDFSRYWNEIHGPFARKITPAELNRLVKKYIQNPAIRTSKAGEPPFDGVVEIYFDSLESLQKWNEWYFSDAGKALQDDEKNFIDRDKMTFVVTEEKVISSSTF